MSNTLFARGAVLAAAISAPLMFGCAAQAGSPEDDSVDKALATNGEVSSQSFRVLPPVSYGNYSWDQYQGHVTVMWPVSQGVCYLTGVGGLLDGTGENAHIEVDNDYWVLTGSSMQNSVQATAACVSWADLGANGGYGFQTWGESSYGGSCGTGACAPNPTYGYTEMWNGYNFCSLSWISGNFANNTDISSWFDGNNWFMSVYEDVTQSSAYGQSLCFGLKLPHYLAQAGTQWWHTGQAPVYLGQADQVMCALAEVSGNYRGGGEHVQIQNLNGAWYLTGSSMQPNTGARAACLRLHQL